MQEDIVLRPDIVNEFAFIFYIIFSLCYTGKQLKDHLKEQHEKFWNEKEKFSDKKIEIADLQICQEPEIDEKAQNRKEMAKLFRKVSEENIPYNQLFDVVKERTQSVSNEDESSNEVNLVLISGRPGIGKTTLTKRILCDMWTKFLFEPDIIFFIRFRDLDYEAKLRLFEFLVPPDILDVLPKEFRNEEYRGKILEKIRKSDKVYIIMDGLDEAKIGEKKLIPHCRTDCINTAEGFIFNLLKGKLLPHSKKLITSRPNRIAELHRDYKPDILLSIQGLDQKGFEQICSNICEDCKSPDKKERRRKKILRYLSNHPDLKSYCHIPVICIMVMESLNKMLEAKRSNAEDYHVDNTLTRIFVRSLNDWLLDNMNLNSFLFKNISKFALKHFDQNQFYFIKSDLKKANVEERYIKTFLQTILKGKKEKIMYFVHLMWQEFLAAVNLRLYTDEREFLESTDSESIKLKNNIFIRLNSEKYRDVATQFLFGLCNDDTLEMLLKNIDDEKGLSEQENRKNCRKALQNFAVEMLKKFADDFSPGQNALVTPPADDVENDSKSVAFVDGKIAAADTGSNGAIHKSNDNDAKQSDDGEDTDQESEISGNSDVDYGKDNIKDKNYDNKSYFGSILPILTWVHEMKDDDVTKEAAKYLLNEIVIGEKNQIFPSDIPAINYVLCARSDSLELKLCHPHFVGNCTRYFIKELENTLRRNPKIKVSLKKFKKK